MTLYGFLLFVSFCFFFVMQSIAIAIFIDVIDKYSFELNSFWLFFGGFMLSILIIWFEMWLDSKFHIVDKLVNWVDRLEGERE